MKEVLITRRRQRVNYCPACLELHDAVTGVGFGDGRPVAEPGDITICWYCGAILRYDEAMIERLVPDAEIKATLAELCPEARKLVLAARERVKGR